MDRRKMLLKDLPPNMIFQMLYKLPNVELSRMRRTCSSMNSFVEQNRRMFSSRSAISSLPLFITSNQNGTDAWSKEQHWPSQDHLLKNSSAISFSNLEVYIEPQNRQKTREVVDLLKKLGITFSNVSLSPLDAESIVELSNSVRCHGDFSVASEKDSSAVLIETLATFSRCRNLKVRARKGAWWPTGRNGFEMTKTFRCLWWPSVDSNADFTQIIWEMYQSEDTGNLERFSINFLQSFCFPTWDNMPPLTVIWNISLLPEDRQIKISPRVIRKMELRHKWALIFEFKLDPSIPAPRIKEYILFVEKDHSAVLDAFQKQCNIKDIDPLLREEFPIASEIRQQEILRQAFLAGDVPSYCEFTFCKMVGWNDD